MDSNQAFESPELICSYSRTAGRDDEMCGADGRLRSHWQLIIAGLDRLGGEELQHRRIELRRLLRENGATYNVHGDPAGLTRAWELDPLPLAIAPEDWHRLEAGLAQRAELLRRIAADLYGERRLLRENIVPPEIVFDAPDFQRTCVDVWPPSGRPPMFFTVDFVRGPQRQFYIVGDRTAWPDGAGYTLENRTAMARVFPDLIRDCNVRRLSGFFRTMQDRLAAALPQAPATPRIGILSAGAQSDTYFEQAYLAAYLGYPLVLGDDLLMRDGALWLKSLDGLEPIDGLLRCVADRRSDPLELEHGSRQGVAGLLEALRRASLAVFNPPGSSLLENPGLRPFLAAAARFFLDADLMLPAPRTWWCGRPRDCSYVVEHLGELVLYDLYDVEKTPVFGGRLSAAAAGRWRQRIRSLPRRFAAAEWMPPSTAPVAEAGRLQPRPQLLRTYLMDDGQGCRVMPGGLALSTGEADDFIDSRIRGTVSKDLWVLATEPQQHVSLWLQHDRVKAPLERSSVLPSRSAQNLFWVGRYAERCEGILRLVRTVVRRISRADRLQDSAERACLELLLAALTRIANAPLNAETAEGGRCRLAPEQELQAILGNPDRAGSLADGLQHMIDSASGVRHLWSVDSWSTINRIEAVWKRVEHAFGRISPMVEIELDRLIRALMAFAGLNSENMTREQGWLLLDIGRRIERAAVLTRILRETLVERYATDVEHLLLEAVLTTTENVITYRQRYRSYLSRYTVVEQLLRDDTNPRSVIYQINRLCKHEAALPVVRGGGRPTAAAVQDLDELLRRADYEQLADSESNPDGHQLLAALLQQVETALNRFSDILAQVYFSHTPVSRQSSGGSTGGS